MPTVEEKRLKLKRLRLQKLRADERPTQGPKRASRQEAIKQERKETFQDMPWYEKALAGAGATTYKTGRGLYGALAKPFMNPLERQAFAGGGEDIEEFYGDPSEGSTAARLGEIGGDVAMFAMPGGAIAKGATKALPTATRLAPRALRAAGIGGAEGVGSAAQHQLQNIGAGQDVSLGEAGLEAGLSAALPFIGSSVGQVAKKAAPGILRSAVKPVGQLKQTMTQKQFETPLKEGLVTKFGGLEAAVDRTTEQVKSLANRRDNLIKTQNISVDITDAVGKTRSKLQNMLKNSEISFDDYKGASNFSDEALKTAKAKPSAKRVSTDPVYFSGKKKTSVSGGDAVDLRKLADKQSKFNPFKPATQNPNKVVYNEAYRRVLEDEIERNLIKKSGKEVANEYRDLKSGMAELIPFQKAAQYRLGQLGNNYSFSLMDLASMGVGGGLGGSVPAKIGTALGVGGGRRLTSTPGGAKSLYQLGSSLDRPSNLRNLGMQLGRSSAFSGRQ